MATSATTLRLRPNFVFELPPFQAYLHAQIAAQHVELADRPFNLGQVAFVSPPELNRALQTDRLAGKEWLVATEAHNTQ